MATSYTPLSSDFTSGVTSVSLPSYSGTAVSFLTSSTFIFSLLLVAAVMGAAVRYAYAGSLRMSASESDLRKSNDEFKRVTIGLLGVLTLFILISTFNRDLLLGDISLDSFKLGRGGVSSPESPDAPSGTRTIPDNVSGPWWEAIKSDPVVRASFVAKGITVNKPACANPSETSCTTVGGLPGDTIATLEKLKSYCNTSFEITGGTENGHKSHGPGKTSVDISKRNSVLNACIQGFPSGPPLSFCHATYSRFGYTFCDEKGPSPHWHVDIR